MRAPSSYCAACRQWGKTRVSHRFLERVAGFAGHRAKNDGSRANGRFPQIAARYGIVGNRAGRKVVSIHACAPRRRGSLSRITETSSRTVLRATSTISARFGNRSGRNQDERPLLNGEIGPCQALSGPLNDQPTLSLRREVPARILRTHPGRAAL